ncbi:hypothetical protein [Massilia genomosp. 1]|uniref:Uncharacterized protein n=1 Tax=Massilia genomosp. 1 TaxID=2609280 RepID=A0ABX0MUT3_9BURK|nr:hypothetical protein [Massilia genomosp. 1]NHZ66526.1 hypothetical protein [Massilia genomosp. 1]
MLIHASRLALISIGIALLTFVLFVMTWTESLWFRCGNFMLDCVSDAATALVIGCGVGMFVALASFSEPDTLPGLKWVSFVLNAVPMFLGTAFWVLLTG